MRDDDDDDDTPSRLRVSESKIYTFPALRLLRTSPRHDDFPGLPTHSPLPPINFTFRRAHARSSFRPFVDFLRDVHLVLVVLPALLCLTRSATYVPRPYTARILHVLTDLFLVVPPRDFWPGCSWPLMFERSHILYSFLFTPYSADLL